jgi:pyruvate ferredoxin oxidoreductase delta subunit
MNKDIKKEKGWKEIPPGGVIDTAGNSKDYYTGGWRTFRPVRDKQACIDCMICWIYCPDSAIEVKDGKLTKINYQHCKGCGICAKVCPKKCIEMVKDR